MFNDWAIRKWSKVLSDDFPLDKATFLICSLIPISYIDMVDDENFVVVNLSDIRKYTNVVKEGCDFLVKEGYAKWLTKNRQYNNTDYDQISIGTSIDFITAVYYFEASKRISTSIPVKQSSVSKRRISKNDISETIELLDEWYESYKIFCAKIHSKTKAEKIHGKIKLILNNVIATGNMTAVELLSYLDCVNAMRNDWLDVPTSYNNNYKFMAMAKQVLAKTTAENLLKLVPYYVDNYPKTAKEGFEETNIYNLSFHFTAMMTKMNKKTGVKSKTQNYDDDKL